jgi:hypothetical protein
MGMLGTIDTLDTMHDSGPDRICQFVDVVSLEICAALVNALLQIAVPVCDALRADGQPFMVTAIDLQLSSI